MTAFAEGRFPVPVRGSLLVAMRQAWDRLAGPGAELTGAQRLDVAEVARRANRDSHLPPWGRREGPTDPIGRVAHEIAGGAQRVDRGWASARIVEVGAPAYVETVAVTATVVALDVFAEAMGVAPEPLPVARPGPAHHAVVDETVDIGAHVPVAAASAGANVGRAMSLVPDAIALFFGVERAFYAAGAEFQELVWDRALSRPQVELVAARTSAVNECFY